VTGDGLTFRNSTRVREAYKLICGINQRYPKQWKILGQLLSICFANALLGQFPDDHAPPLAPGQWQLDKWDQTFLNEAKKYYLPFCELQDTEDFFSRQIHFEYKMWVVKNDEEISWQELLDYIEETIRRYPVSAHYVDASLCHYQLYGPLAAAKYLERHKGNAGMRDCQLAYRRRGDYYFEAKNWKKARANYRKFLKWPRSQAWKTYIGQRIQLCDRQIPSKKAK